MLFFQRGKLICNSMKFRNMNFFFNGAILPKEIELMNDINEAATRLHSKLKQLDINSLDISDYNKRYLGNHIINIISTLHKYSYILSWSVADTDVPLERFVLVDHGGGSGILSLLAKEFGIGTVIYNDIYDISCRDAKIVGLAIENEANYYVHGDIDAVADFLRAKSLYITAIASYDVIEHIYDIEGFLTDLSSLSRRPFSVVMASGANSFNPIKRKRFMHQHVEIEYKDHEKKWGHKERDCLQAYFNARKDIISTHAPSLSDTEIDCIARATRGLIKPEIEDCVDEYLITGKISREPDHPTNTCDPYTGNWAEHLMDIDHLSKILVAAGFEVDIMSGYYGNSNNILKRLIGSILNFIISLLKNKGLIFAPFFIIYAKKI